MYVFSPARYFVVGIRSSPENPSVFSKTVVTFGFCFRNFFALSFFISQRVFLGNFRMAMFPTMSWGMREALLREVWRGLARFGEDSDNCRCLIDVMIFFMVGFRGLDIKGFGV